MDIVDSVIDFVKNIFRQRINAAQSQVKAKISDAQTRAKTKASNAVNAKLDQSLNKAKDKVTGAKKDDTSTPGDTKG